MHSLPAVWPASSPQQQEITQESLGSSQRAGYKQKQVSSCDEELVAAGASGNTCCATSTDIALIQRSRLAEVTSSEIPTTTTRPCDDSRVGNGFGENEAFSTERGSLADDAPEVCASIVIAALRRSVQPGDASVIPSIAAILRRGVGAAARSEQPVSVRLVALESLRALTPRFPKSWPGFDDTLKLLCLVCKTDQDAEVRRAALSILREIGLRGDKMLMSTCESLLLDPLLDVAIREDAADALKSFVVEGDPTSIQAAMVATSDSHAYIWRAGLEILQKILIAGCAARCDWLFESLARLIASHPDAEARAALYKHFPHIADQGSRSVAIRAATDGLLCDPSLDVRLAALSALQRLWARGDLDAMVALTILTDDSSELVLRCAALDALAAVAAMRDGSEAAARASVRCAQLLQDPEDSVRSSAMRAFKRLVVRGDVSVIGELTPLLRHREIDVRRLVVEAIGHVATPNDKDVLLSLEGLRDDPDAENGIQFLASQALRLIPHRRADASQETKS